MSKVDEDYVMGLIAGENSAKKPVSTTTKEEQLSSETVSQSKERKGKPKESEIKDYEEKFLRRVEMRDRKQICIGGRDRKSVV